MQRFGDQGLTDIWAVRIRGVDQRRSKLDRTSQHSFGCITIGRLAPNALARDAHRAKAETTHRELTGNIELEHFSDRRR
jgi:hypothetical protein